LRTQRAQSKQIFSFAGERPAKEKHSALMGMGYEINKLNML
jgi:hypothetical protein